MCFIYIKEKILLKCNHTNPIMSTLQGIHHLKKQSPNMAPESPPTLTPEQPLHLWVLMLPSVHLTLQCHQTCFLFHPLRLCTVGPLPKYLLPFCDWPTPTDSAEITSESLPSDTLPMPLLPQASVEVTTSFGLPPRISMVCRLSPPLRLHVNLSVFPTTL